MKEKAILAYFNTPEQAEQALEKLKSLQLIDSSIDRFDGYPGDGVEGIMNPISGDFRSLGDLSLGGDFIDRNAGILAAASVSASGMSSGGEENMVSGRDILLTAVVAEEDFDKAQAIVDEAGAL